MKNRIKYLLSMTISFTIGLYSYNHPEKYHVLIPIIFGTLFILGSVFLIEEIKK